MNQQCFSEFKHKKSKHITIALHKRFKKKLKKNKKKTCHNFSINKIGI